MVVVHRTITNFWIVAEAEEDHRVVLWHGESLFMWKSWRRPVACGGGVIIWAPGVLAEWRRTAPIAAQWNESGSVDQDNPDAVVRPEPMATQPYRRSKTRNHFEKINAGHVSELVRIDNRWP
jgi:hypothetical protein